MKFNPTQPRICLTGRLLGSNVYMSMMFYVQDGPPLTRRQAWGRLFGICIEKTREAGGRSVEEAARLAGITPRKSRRA